MTKKDYVKIAQAIKESSDRGELSKFMLVAKLNVIFLEDNPRFDIDGFMEACE